MDSVFVTTTLVPIAIAFLSIMAGSGFWHFITEQMKKGGADDKLLLGIAHSYIVDKCEYYINRGHITNSELESFYSYNISPYMAKGGNGVAKQLIDQVYELPRRPPQELHAL